MLIKGIVIICMVLGLLGTFIHKMPGPPLIIVAALLYGTATGFITLTMTLGGDITGVSDNVRIGGANH